MVTNVTGGARNNHRRFETQTQQDITGTPRYHSTQRNSSHVDLTRPRSDSRGGKRRKLSQGSGMPEFNLEHARRDLLKRGQEDTSRTDRKRNSDTTESHLTPYETYYYRQAQQTRPRQTVGLNLPSQSSHLRWNSNSNDINGASSTIANSSTSPYSHSQAQAASASRRSSLLHGSSLTSNAFSQSSFSPPSKLHQPFALPSPSAAHLRWNNDGANVPPQLHTNSISPASNKDSLSIITSSPPLPAFPLNSTTPAGTPPSARKPNSSVTHDHQLSSPRTRPKSDTTNSESNISVVGISTSSKKSRLPASHSRIASPATSRLAALRTSSSSASRSSPAAPSSSSTIPEPLPQPQDADSFSASFYTQFIKFSTSASSKTPAFYPVPPQKSEWFGPCCVTPSQRQELSKSFIFTNSMIPREEDDEGESWVSERMGLGCWKLKKEEFEEIEKRNEEMRMLSLAYLSIDEVEEREEEEEGVKWDELEWEESDFDFSNEEEEMLISQAQSRPRLTLQPPPSHPRPPTLASINENYDELSEPESELPTKKITLSNGPWNAPSPTDDLPPPLVDALMPLDQHENEEDDDFPISTKSFLYKSAYEPFPSPSPSPPPKKDEVVEIKLDDDDIGMNFERVLENLTDDEELESCEEKNELFDGDDDDDEIEDPDERFEASYLRNAWDNYSRSDW